MQIKPVIKEFSEKITQRYEKMIKEKMCSLHEVLKIYKNDIKDELNARLNMGYISDLESRNQLLYKLIGNDQNNAENQSISIVELQSMVQQRMMSTIKTQYTKTSLEKKNANIEK